MQNRWKSKVMWGSILSALLLIYNAIAANFGFATIGDGAIETVVNVVLGGLVSFGILNNPTTSDKF